MVQKAIILLFAVMNFFHVNNLSRKRWMRTIFVILLRYGKSVLILLKVLFYIGDRNLIAEIIFSDYYRTFFLCMLSIGVSFFMRNASTRKKALLLVVYEFIMAMPFFWIIIVGIIFTEFCYESIVNIVQWSLRWMLYFTLSTILQFVIYHFLWKKNRILKIVTLLFSIFIVIVPLYVFNFK